MTYNFLFIITSAIIPFKVGSANTTVERFEQTLQTISSIREKIPNSSILLVETSQFKLSDEYLDELKSRVNIFIDCYSDSILQSTYSNLEQNPKTIDFGKSLLETRGMILAFEKIIKNNLHQKYNRIFKLTGRYYLNSDFEISDYCSKCLIGKYVFNVCDFSKDSDDYFHKLMNINGQLTTGLWSFCNSLIVETLNLYYKSFEYIDWILSTNNCLDIERCLYKFIDRSKVINLKTLGVTQIHGPTGKYYQL
jgi:hypothetical protein